ncbi:MAG: rRNA maturation RNase YbeY [Planctomycetes bacterium]|nr:rRNA maturation RNase YbeY [Planctomycetota bacterium]
MRRLVAAVSLTTERIVRAVAQAAGNTHIESLSVAIVDDRTMAALHRRFLGDDRPTDVLTFDLRDDPRSAALEGEIVVSAEMARREAARRGLDVGEELLRYVVHGALHLLGMDDRDAAGRRRMRRAENTVLRQCRRAGPSSGRSPAEHERSPSARRGSRLAARSHR